VKRLIGLCALILIVIGVSASPRAVIADDPDPDDGYTPQPDTPPAAEISVQSNEDGVTIYIGITDTSPGVPGDAVSDGDSTGSDSSGPSCTANPMELGLGHIEWLIAESPFHPGDSPWTVECDDGYFGVVWVPMNTDPADVQVVIGPPDPIDPLSVAAELRDQLPVPDMAISANPDTGLVGLPSWFWVDGYDGAPISSSSTLGGITVEVQIVPQRYTWSFGDGANLDTTSPGQPYPAESDIQHSYEQSSLGAGGAFAVTVEISFSAQYRVNGGAWQSLDAITRSFTSNYPVQQLQSVLTGN
jgi:hypothetical protein